MLDRLQCAIDEMHAGGCADPIVVIEGDSLANDGGVPNSLHYAEVAIAALTFASSINHANIGLGGETCAQMVAQGATNVDSLYSPMQKYNIASINCGINDAFAGASIATIWSRMQEWITDRQAKGFTVIVSTVTSTGSLFFPGGAAGRASLNSLIIADAAEVCGISSCSPGGGSGGYIVADAGSDPDIGCDTCWSNSTYFQNNPHLTAAGYAVWAAYYKQALLFAGLQ